MTSTSGMGSPPTGIRVPVPGTIRRRRRSRPFPFLLLLLVMGLKVVVKGQTFATPSDTIDLWSLLDDPPFPELNLTSNSVTVPRCDPGVTQGCFLENPRPMNWESAHAFCRGKGGFLASSDELGSLKDIWPPEDSVASPGKNLIQEDFIWTALTMLEGRYQWLSHHPSIGEFVEWKEGQMPPLWSRNCAALNPRSQRFQPYPCSTSFTSFCYLPPTTPPSDLGGRDVELRVASSVATVDGWAKVSERQWATVHLTCTVHNRSTGAPLEEQPPIFWSKDGAYVGSYLPTIFPDVILGTTKSTGTYWCETWAGRSPTRLVSNKILVTREDWLVLILVAHRYEGAKENTESDAILELRRSFEAYFPGFDSFPVDLISVERETSPGTTNILSKYRFQVHIRNVNESLDRVQSLFEDEGLAYKRIYERNGYSQTSTAALSTYCPRHTEKYKYGNLIEWPFSSAGKVHPLHYRCEISDRWLRAGHCRWNYTHGATVIFDHSQCKSFDPCPRDYTSVSNYVCVSTTTPDAWARGFHAAYKIFLLRDLLAFSYLLQEGQYSVYERTKEMLKETKNFTRVWLPVRRLAPFGPLTFVGPGSSEFPYSLYDAHWAPGHPQPDEDCLALDLKDNRLLTQPCDTVLPFVALFNVTGLKDIPSGNELPGMIVNNSLSCPRTWFSTNYQKRGVCFQMFRGVESTWEEAKNFCEERGAELVTPAVGVLDWVYRQYLNDIRVDSVWMSVERRGNSPLEGPRLDYINWKADVNQSLQFPVLETDGWSREGSSSTKTNILCQKTPREVSSSYITISESGDASQRTVCVDVMQETLMANGIDSMQCFVNGRVIGLKQGDKSGCRYEIDDHAQGEIQCQAWILSPFHLAKSNILLYRKPNTFTYAVNIEQDTAYISSLHDSTFALWNESYVNSLREKLGSESKQLRVPYETLHVENFFYSRLLSNGTLRLNLNVDLEFTDDQFKALTEESVFQALGNGLSDEPSAECGSATVSSTMACQRMMTKDSSHRERNLTWARSEGRATVLPEELCVTSRGEPVTRECLGSFLLGYCWGPVEGNCSGEPSNVTSRLWNISRSSLDSPKTVAELANVTNDGSLLQPADIHFLATIFQSLSKVEEFPENDFENVVETFNNIMEGDAEAFQSVQERLKSSTILLKTFEDIAFNVKLPENEQSLKVTRELVTIERVDVGINSTIIGFQSKTSTVPDEGILRGIDDLHRSVSEAAIVLPKGLTHLVLNESGTSDKVNLAFAVYRSPKFFQDNESYPSYRVNSQILQASYNNMVIKNLEEPVELIFRPLQLGNDLKCVFWDVQDSAEGRWSTKGCWLGKAMGDRQTCLCNHLTSFALLINYDDEDHVAPHATSLSAITTIGCAISIFSFLMVFATFFLFEKWRRPLRNKILVNLSFAVFCSLVIFLAGINQTWNEHLCRAVAVGLHYFVLASFGWMLVEAIHQYLRLVKVVNTYIPRFLWKASIGAWGAPLVLIVIVLVCDSSFYDNKAENEAYARICWMSSKGFKYFFLPPLVATMTVNLVLFAIIVYRVTCGRTRLTSTQKEKELFLTQISTAICIFSLLGFTWIFGLLSFWKLRLVFSYLFCIFNTLQGLFIFIFHVFRERTARNFWNDFVLVLSDWINPSKEDKSRNNLMQPMVTRPQMHQATAGIP